MFTFNYSLNVLKVAFFALIINVIPAVNEHKKEKMVEHSRAKTLNSIFFSQTIRQSEKKKKRCSLTTLSLLDDDSMRTNVLYSP